MKALKWFVPLFLAAASVHAYADECQVLTDAFDAAVRSKQGPVIESAFNAIARNVECDFEKDKFRVAAVAAEIGVLSDPAQSSAHKAALAFVTQTLAVAGRWQLAEKLGDQFWRAGNQPEAKNWYEAALSIADTHPVRSNRFWRPSEVDAEGVGSVDPREQRRPRAEAGAAHQGGRTRRTRDRSSS